MSQINRGHPIQKNQTKSKISFHTGPTVGNDNHECPLRCEQTCSNTHIKCPGKIDDNECVENDFCHPKGYDNDGDLCPGFCPSECSPDEHKCPSPPDSNGCEQPPSCKPKGIDNSGGICPNKACPVFCNIDVEIPCKGIVNMDGCYEDDICIPKEYSNTGILCPGRCPVHCDPWLEILCDGQMIFHGPKSGCFNEDECYPVAKSRTGETCDADLDEHGCPVTCPPPDYIECPPQNEENGCKSKIVCVQLPKGNDGEYCPAHSVCPTVCDPHEVKCNQTGVDDNGCKLPDICVQQERNINGELCTVQCPLECNDNQILCPGGIYV